MLSASSRWRAHPTGRKVMSLLPALLPVLAAVVFALQFGPRTTPAAATSEPDENLVNFESPHVHPIDLTPDGRTLVAVNTAAGRLEVFDAGGSAPRLQMSIPVGMDPVSVRARTNDEVWVVNHISDSISIVDLTEGVVVRTLATDNEPADVVFAGQQAFVTASAVNAVNVFDLNNLGLAPERITIQGEDPRALAVSPDGGTVYAAVFESGNGTTSLRGRAGLDANAQAFNIVSRPEGPYGGQNPPPNSGTEFDPAMSPDLPDPPQTSIIVRLDEQGRWMDDNNGDWTQFVSGDLSALSGRVEGWTLVDRDVAVIDTSSLNVSYQTGLMNLNMAMAVNPANGRVTVVGTEALNEVRFEQNHNGVFLRVNIADFGPGGSADVNDLNPHLDYSTATVAAGVREQSIGDPRGASWNAAGTEVYITGMGSDNVIVARADGSRLGRIDVGAGPTGIVLDDARGRGYVMNKFSGSISVIDTAGRRQIVEVPFYDPTPEFINTGRRILYNTHDTSGLGHISCASCHVDGRTDRLAWDLGNPQGEMVTVATGDAVTGVALPDTFDQHPMKGPMLTQSLQDIVDFPAFHWRNDRNGIEDFNATFTGLMGRDTQISTGEMDSFIQFLDTIHFPPNPFRDMGGFRFASLTLPDGTFVSTPDWSALRGNNDLNTNCMACHASDETVRLDRATLFVGDNGMVPPAFAAMYDRLGFWPDSADGSTSGFGLGPEGVGGPQGTFRIDRREATTALAAELMSIEGASGGGHFGGEVRQDAHAGVGQQVTIGASPSQAELDRLTRMTELSDFSFSLELVASTAVAGVPVGYRFVSGDNWLGDRDGVTATTDDLIGQASDVRPVTFTLVVEGTADRLGIDIDNDGVRNGDEVQPVRLASVSDQTSTEGDVVSLTVSAGGGSGARSFGASGLPTGLSIDTSSGVISGTTTAAGTFNVTVTVTDSTGSDSVSFTWTVQSSGGGGGGVCAGLTQEAEDAALSGAMVVGSDSAASGGRYVSVADGTGQAWSIGSPNQAAFCFDVAEAGAYRIDASVFGPDSLSDSFFVTVDGQPTDGHLWDVGVTSGFEAGSVSDRDGADPVLVNLSAGEHDVVFFHREDGTLLDQVSLVRVGDGGGAGGSGECAGLTQQAEDAALSGAMVVGSDSGAVGGGYVHVPDGTGQAWNFGSANRAVFCFDVAEAGTYRVDALVEGLDSLSDSFFVTVDGFPADGYLWDLGVTNGFETVSLSDRDGDDPVFVDLSAGEHELVVYQREDGARLDQITLVRTGGGGGGGACAGLSQEAEDAVLSGAMTVVSDGSASGGQYVNVPEGTGQSWSFGSSSRAVFCFDVAVAGTYRIDAQVSGPDLLSDSFFVTMDGEPADGWLWDLGVTSGFETVAVSDRTGADPVLIDLTVGQHELIVFHREDGSRLDSVTLVPVGGNG